jgi:hypothetical protein
MKWKLYSQCSKCKHVLTDDEMFIDERMTAGVQTWFQRFGCCPSCGEKGTEEVRTGRKRPGRHNGYEFKEEE